uniref:Ninjurin 2 n=1 Tax=Anabas testudineus TaxID=64144 RepID=A0A7N6BYW8_ANATE
KQTPTAPSEKVYHPININHYATKKSAAQSMLDVALLIANSSQLKTVLYVGPQYHFYIPLINLYFADFKTSAKYDLNDVRKQSRLNSMNNMATVFVFFIVLINIFITSFATQHHYGLYM